MSDEVISLCPFCGARGMVTINTNVSKPGMANRMLVKYSNDTWGTCFVIDSLGEPISYGKARVVCGYCGIHGELLYFDAEKEGHKDKAKEIVIARWNTRVTAVEEETEMNL